MRSQYFLNLRPLTRKNKGKDLAVFRMIVFILRIYIPNEMHAFPVELRL